MKNYDVLNLDQPILGEKAKVAKSHYRKKNYDLYGFNRSIGDCSNKNKPEVYGDMFRTFKDVFGQEMINISKRKYLLTQLNNKKNSDLLTIKDPVKYGFIFSDYKQNSDQIKSMTGEKISLVFDDLSEQIFLGNNSFGKNLVKVKNKLTYEAISNNLGVFQ